MPERIHEQYGVRRKKYEYKKYQISSCISRGCLIEYHMLQGNAQSIGLSPNGKATDSDSVIFLVRIQVAQ